MKLPNDVARCRGSEYLYSDEHLGVTKIPCQFRETCARYIQRDERGPRTPVYLHLCDFESETFNEFIEQVKEGEPC